MEKKQPERKDVLRHRERILAAAQSVFSEHGVGVSLDVVTAAAELGKGTLYRHFPDRESLLLALLDREIDVLCRVGEECAPEQALLKMLRHAAKSSQTSPALADGWRLYLTSNPGSIQGSKRLAAGLEKPLAVAKASGQVRDEITVADMALIIRHLSIPMLSAQGAPLSERTLELLMHGVFNPR